MRALFILIFIIRFFDVKSQWKELGNLNSFIGATDMDNLVCDKNGNIYTAPDVFNGSILKWNGQQWTKFGFINNIWANSICINSVGKMFGRTSSSLTENCLSEWNGSSWINLNGPCGIVSMCADGGGNLYVGGTFTNTSGDLYITKWDGNSWTALGGITGWYSHYKLIRAICADKFGNIYATGGFTNTAGNFYVAKWDGSAWTEVGGFNALAANSVILALHCDVDGNLYAGGSFSNAEGNAYVAKWNGVKWSELEGLDAGEASYFSDNSTYAICSDKYRNIYVGGWLKSKKNGNYFVAKWTGNKWVELDIGRGFGKAVKTLCIDSMGNLYAAGGFKNDFGNNFVAVYPNATFTSLYKQSVHQIEFTTFPNPCTNQLNISSDLPIHSVQICDLSGKSVLAKTFDTQQNTYTIDVNHLAKGLYIAQLQSEKGKQFVKVLKE